MIFQQEQFNNGDADLGAITHEQTTHWDTLAAGSDHPDPVNSSSCWQLTAHTNPGGVRPQIVMMQTSDSQVAFTMRKEGSRLLLLPLEAHWCFGCPILGPDAVMLLGDVIAHLRNAGVTDAIEIEVSGLDPDGSHARQIDETFDQVLTLEQDRQAMASLEGGIDGWMSRRSSNLRRNLRKAAKKAALNDITFERCSPDTDEAVSALYARMLEIEWRSWKGAQMQGLIALPRFYEQLLYSYADKNMARIIIAKQGRKDIGFCYGGLLHGIYRGQQSSYVEDYAAYNIGNLMHYETAKWLCDEGAILQHFGPLQDETPRKDHFCETMRRSVVKIIRAQ